MNRKPLFDAIRKLLGRGFRQAEVEALDKAIDTVAGRAPNGGARSMGPQGLALIRQFEGCARLRADGLVEAYPDPGTGGAPWTIGWGATGPGIGPGTVWTRQQCDARLVADIQRHARDVAEVLDGASTNQMQFDALVSFHYNTGAIARSTLLKRHLAGDYEAACREFGRWNRAAGRVLPGLVRRRKAEADLYRSS